MTSELLRPRTPRAIAATRQFLFVYTGCSATRNLPYIRQNNAFAGAVAAKRGSFVSKAVFSHPETNTDAPYVRTYGLIVRTIGLIVRTYGLIVRTIALIVRTIGLIVRTYGATGACDGLRAGNWPLYGEKRMLVA
jgi:hypothetical protein